MSDASNTPPKFYDTWLSGEAKLVDLRILLLGYASAELKSHREGTTLIRQRSIIHLVTRVDEKLDLNLSFF